MAIFQDLYIYQSFETKQNSMLNADNLNGKIFFSIARCRGVRLDGLV